MKIRTQPSNIEEKSLAAEPASAGTSARTSAGTTTAPVGVSDISALTGLQTSLSYTFTTPELLLLSLTHKSYSHEQASGLARSHSDNERLEFLGDAVLDLALSAILMKRFPNDTEGALSKKRASLVNEETLAKLAMELRLDTLIRLGKGETKTGGLQKPRILASSFEAIVGAIFLDGGFPPAMNAAETLFDARLGEIALSNIDFKHDFKTRLQERAQEVRKATPTYKIESELGPDHDKLFEVSVLLDGEPLARGSGKSKKSAEQEAARKALELLDENNQSPEGLEKTE